MAINADVCVLGGGIVGLTFARLLLQQRPDWKVILLDGGDDKSGDGTSVVVNAAVADVLRSLDSLPDNSRPIRQVRVSFAGGGKHGIGDGSVLGYGIAHKTVQADLAKGVECITARATGISEEDDAVVIHTKNKDAAIGGDSSDSGGGDSGNGNIRARALVAACAVPFLPADFRSKTLDYQQTVLSFAATAGESLDSDADAFQHFGSNGVAVMVPRTDGNAGVILCATPATAARLNALSDNALATHLHKEFNLHSHHPQENPLMPQGRRFAYAPRLAHTAPLAHRRIALIGQAATALHPIGAQGLNLGIGDAQYLATALGKGDEMPTIIQDYAHARLAAHRKTAALTSTLALGVRCRARPFHLLGGALAAAISLPMSQRLFLPLATAVR